MRTIPHNKNNKAVNINDVAKLAGVHRSTVSRVISGHNYVSDTARNKVKNAIKELGYEQNSIARNLRTKTSKMVGLLVSDISNAYFATLAQSIEACLQANGYGLLLCATNGDAEKEEFYLKYLKSNQVAGLVIASLTPNLRSLIYSIALPIVIGGYEKKMNNFSNIVSVLSDEENGGYLASKALILRGSRKLLYIGVNINENFSDSLTRFDGVCRAVEEFQKNYDDLSVVSVNIPEGSLQGEEFINLCHNIGEYDGIVCWNDIIGIGVLKGLRNKGIDVPGQIQVIGFDGIAFGKYTVPTLASVQQNISELGHIFGESMIALLNDQQEYPQFIILPIEIIVRNSLRNIVE